MGGGPVIFTLTGMDEIVGSALGVLVTLTGRAFVYLLSFGRWRGESLDGEESRVFAAAGSLWFRREGRVVVTDTGQLFAGIAFYILLVLTAVAYAALA